MAPLQKDKHLIGTQSWEVFGGVGFVRGYRWGTLTIRAAAEYADGVLDAGELGQRAETPPPVLKR